MSIKQKDQLLSALAESDNVSGIFSKSEVLQVAEASGLSKPMWFFKAAKVGRNQFNPSMVGQVVTMPVQNNTPQKVAPLETIQSQPESAKILTQAKLAVEIENLVPEKDDTYVPFGFYTDLTKIVKSGMFYPVFICGLSGNGKTMMVDRLLLARNERRFVLTSLSKLMRMI